MSENHRDTERWWTSPAPEPPTRPHEWRQPPTPASAWSSPPPPPPQGQDERELYWTNRRVRNNLVVAVALTTAFSLLAWGFSETGLGDTGAFFILLPAMFALALCFVTPVNPGAKLLRGTTMVLLLVSIVLREGSICVLLASPLVYGIVILFHAIGTMVRRSDRQVHGVGVLVLLALGLGSEGVLFDLPTAGQVQREIVVEATPADVGAGVAATPRYDGVPVPTSLRLPFPRPTGATGAGLDVGDRRTIEFGHGEAGAMELIVAESSPGRVTFVVDEDTTPIAGWMTMRTVTFAWEPDVATTGATAVEVTIDYERELDPAWYFGPLEWWFTGEAAEYLALVVTTPGPGE